MAISANSKKLLLRIVLFLVYLLLGATIFHFVENDNAKKERKNNDFKKTTYKNFTAKYNISEEDMRWLFGELKRAMKFGYDLDVNRYPSSDQWGFMNAFHFAGNVVTTIGYGHIAPLTVLGRFLCIIYALFGIPLTGLTLRSIGNRISEGIGTLIKLFDRRVYNRETEKIEIKTAVIAFCILLIIIIVPAIGFHYLEHWDYTDAVYFCFITLMTIGFGDFVPGKAKHDVAAEAAVTLEFLNLIYMVVGLAVMSGVIVSISGVIEEKTKNFGVDPMEALRNIRVENLNSRALKKLGYKMGPGMGPDDPRAHQRLPPKMASRTMGVPMSSANNVNTVERSRSAETMEFQGPTPVMYLNKQTNNGTTSDANTPLGSPPGTRMFNNKVAPAHVTDAQNNITSGQDVPAKSVENLQGSSEQISTETEPAEEVESGDEDNIVNKSENNGNVNHGDSLQPPPKRDSKNELVVAVQVTPLPSPIASPIPLQAMPESPPPLNRSDPDIDDDIETYEESMKGSIDSTFARDTRQYDSKPSGALVHQGSLSDSFSKDFAISMDGMKFHEMTPIESAEKHSGTANGFLSKGDSFGPRKGRVKNIEEHIDLGDRSLSRIAR